MMYRSRSRQAAFRLWLRKHRRTLRRLELVCICLAALLYIMQIFYPGQRMLPFVRVAGQGMGGQSVATATAKINSTFEAQGLTVATDATKQATSLTSLGATANTRAAAQAAADYPFLQRIIPFSSVYVMLTRDQPVTATYQGDQLTNFAVSLEQSAARPAVNASVKMNDGKAVLVPSVPAKNYPAAATVERLKAAALVPGGIVRISPQTTPAPRSDADVQPIVDAANKAIKDRLSFTIDGKKIHPKSNEIAAWLGFAEENGSLQITVNQEAVARYLIHVEGDAHKAPGKTHVKLIDTYEVDRKVGPSGKGVDPAKATIALQQAIRTGKYEALAFTIGDLPPEIVNDRTVSNSDAVFGDLLSRLAISKGGYGIAAIQMNGKAAKANGDKQFIAASTYKLYVAYVWFKQVAAGTASWSDTISGQSAERCFELMIVRSDNDCAVAFAAKVGGWAYVDTAMKELGLTGTSLRSGNLKTTASDLAYFMYRLENGTLVNAADKSRLAGYMERQIYRDGIPAGTKAKVADKVGFVDGYLNDAGIVYATKGAYVLVVLSYGSSWAQIADATEQIDSYLTK